MPQHCVPTRGIGLTARSALVSTAGMGIARLLVVKALALRALRLTETTLMAICQAVIPLVAVRVTTLALRGLVAKPEQVALTAQRLAAASLTAQRRGSVALSVIRSC